MLKGRLEEFSLTEVFDLVSKAHRSGALKVTKEDSEGIIFFKNGEIFFAVTQENRIPLGLRLVDAELLTEKELEEALEEQKKIKCSVRLGQILIAKSYISAETLELFVQEQILDALFEIMSWGDGEFEFAQDISIDEEDIGIYMSPSTAISEAHERLGEWQKLSGSLPSPHVSLGISSAPVRSKDDIVLKPDEWKIVYILRQPKTIAQLKRKVHLTSPSLYRTLHRLLEMNILEVAEAADVPVETTAEARKKSSADLKTVDLKAGSPAVKKEAYPKKPGSRYPQKYVLVPPAQEKEKEDVPVEWRAYYDAIAERLARAQQGM